jgi:hypothetical protein
MTVNGQTYSGYPLHLTNPESSDDWTGIAPHKVSVVAGASITWASDAFGTKDYPLSQGFAICACDIYTPPTPELELTVASASLSTAPWNAYCPASSCIDGVTISDVGANCMFGRGDMCHTQTNVLNPYLRLDLGMAAAVARVVVYNRGNCCWERLGYHEVWVGDESELAESNTLCSTGNVNRLMEVDAGDYRVIDHRCTIQPMGQPGLVGRYVFVRLPGSSRTLNIQEVKVFAPSM